MDEEEKRIFNLLATIEKYQKDIGRLFNEAFFETKTDWEWELILDNIFKKLNMIATTIMRLSIEIGYIGQMIESKKELKEVKK